MKKGFYILLIMFTAMVVVSCDKTKSYTDMLNAERKAIDQLIDENGFEILDEFPKDTVFKAKQFVELENGVYLNIIDRGTKDTAVYGSTIVLSRFSVRFFLNGDTTVTGNLGEHSNGTSPVEFRYGTYTSSNSGYYNPFDVFISPGMASALQYVGDSSRVSLIVPFKQMGSDFQSSGTPLFYKEIKFVFLK